MLPTALPNEACAPAKLNLSLRVVGRRADGYHLLESLVVFCDLADRLEIQPATDDSFLLNAPAQPALCGLAAEQNLVMQALQAWRQQSGDTQPYRIRLHKHIPAGAGLGGGSADAAAMLRYLASAAGLAADDARILAIALSLGADVPACLLSQPLIMRGIGEKLSPITLVADSPSYVVLMQGVTALPTAEIFREFHQSATSFNHSRNDDDHLQMAQWGNDLIAAASRQCPQIGELIAAIASSYHCRYASMTGSGSVCFGLFDGLTYAEEAAKKLSALLPDHWQAVTRFKRMSD